MLQASIANLDILDSNPALKAEVEKILEKDKAKRAANDKAAGYPIPTWEQIEQMTDKSILVPNLAWIYAEIIGRRMDIDDHPLYYRETLNLGASTAGDVNIFDTDHRTSGKNVTNVELAGEAEANTVYFVQGIGIRYGSDLAQAEIDRLEKEGLLKIDFEGVNVFERKLGHLGGFGEAELDVSALGAKTGTATTADTYIMSKGEPSKLAKPIKLPTGAAWRIYFSIAGNVATALAGDIEVILFTTRGKRKKQGA